MENYIKYILLFVITLYLLINLIEIVKPYMKEYKHEILYVSFFCIIALVIFDYNKKQSEERSQKRKEKYRVEDAICKITPSCQDKTAKNLSRYPTIKVVISTTGNIFFGGKQCTSDCSGHIAGYNWAEEQVEIKPNLEEDDCFSNSQSFSEGCEIYLDEYIYDVCSGRFEPFPYNDREMCSDDDGFNYDGLNYHDI